ncbi:MAG: hypothetical protein WED09_04810 [Homoserinimonas sp.]
MSPKHRSGDEPVPDDVPDADKPRPRIRRRVTTDPVPGTDPQPSPEPRRHPSGENDEQLQRDVPPHWG